MTNFLTKALSEGTNSAGGYTVPEEWAKKIYDLMQENSKLVPLMEQVKMASDIWYAPTVTGGSTAHWIDENAEITDSNMTFGQVTLTAKKIAAKMIISSELEEDSLVDIMNIVSAQMGRDLALTIDDEILNGTSSTWSMSLRADAGNTVEAGDNGDALTVSKFSDAIYEGQKDFFEYDYAIMHPRSVRDLRNLVDSNNRPLLDVATFGSALYKEGVVGTIMGLKIITSTKVPINLTKGTGTDLTDIIVVKSKACGIFGRRRKMTAHKFYDIDYDRNTLQVNLRCAFTIAYPNAICVIKDIA